MVKEYSRVTAPKDIRLQGAQAGGVNSLLRVSVEPGKFTSNREAGGSFLVSTALSTARDCAPSKQH